MTIRIRKIQMFVMVILWLALAANVIMLIRSTTQLDKIDAELTRIEKMHDTGWIRQNFNEQRSKP